MEEDCAMSQLPPNPALADLAVLIGEWDVVVPEVPGARGRASFEWLEGGAYLRFHSDAPDPAPSATLIIGRDDSAEIYTVLHYDSRGVSRVYQMTFADRVWKIRREAPGFWQRFSGTISDDDTSITATWDKSPDGSQWNHDFDIIYTRVSPPAED
jgi:hypothetical protein